MLFFSIKKIVYSAEKNCRKCGKCLFSILSFKQLSKCFAQCMAPDGAGKPHHHGVKKIISFSLFTFSSCECSKILQHIIRNHHQSFQLHRLTSLHSIHVDNTHYASTHQMKNSISTFLSRQHAGHRKHGTCSGCVGPRHSRFLGASLLSW